MQQQEEIKKLQEEAVPHDAQSIIATFVFVTLFPVGSLVFIIVIVMVMVGFMDGITIVLIMLTITASIFITIVNLAMVILLYRSHCHNSFIGHNHERRHDHSGHIIAIVMISNHRHGNGNHSSWYLPV